MVTYVYDNDTYIHYMCNSKDILQTRMQHARLRQPLARRVLLALLHVLHLRLREDAALAVLVLHDLLHDLRLRTGVRGRGFAMERKKAGSRACGKSTGRVAEVREQSGW